MKIRTFNLVLLAFFLSLQSCQKSKQQEKTSDKKPPNILFVISDDQSFQHTSFAGCNYVNTPAFDRVASEGIYFTNCYSSAPSCAPSRGSIVTGRHLWQNEQSGQHASSWMKKYVPFIDVLAENGYSTGRTGKGVDPFQYAKHQNDSLWRKENAAGKTHSNILYDRHEDERYTNGIENLNYFENFKYFIDNVSTDKPFFFWFGAYEPHRKYEKGSWKRMGKKLEDVDKVPEFLPDTEEIRGDLLDYAVEIEWFDLHLQKMLDYLQIIGELNNTIVLVTSDNGMPFPRAKANCYEYGIHVPLAIRYPKEFLGNRRVDDIISFVDFAPTFLEITGINSKAMLPISGKSFLNILKSKKQGKVDSSREFIVAGRERHSSSQYRNQGYPQRVIRKSNFMYIWNIKPERWPAGAPQRMDPNDSTSLFPMYGMNEDGEYIKKGAFNDIDDSPSKSYLIENYSDPKVSTDFKLATEKRPEFELYDIRIDPNCLDNLVDKKEYESIVLKLKSKLIEELTQTQDPRIIGPDKEIFDFYKRYSEIRKFPKPEL